MSDPLYRKELLRLAADAHGAGHLQDPHTTGHAFNPVCGDKVTVEISIVGGHIAAIAQDTKACVLTQASASILGQSLKGATRADVEALRRAVDAMLEAGAAPPFPPFEAYAAFDGAIAFPSRHRCVLLPFEAVLSAFDALEAGQPARIGTER
jgi:nitrogen fixation protein NifU and related proteins